MKSKYIDYIKENSDKYTVNSPLSVWSLNRIKSGNSFYYEVSCFGTKVRFEHFASVSDFIKNNGL